MKQIFSTPPLWQQNDGFYSKLGMTDVVSTSFTSEMQDNLFCIEDNSWWFRFRSNIIKTTAKKFFSNHETIHDIGGGNGFTTKVLQDEGYDVVLLEPAFAACQNAQKRELKNIVCGTLNDEDFLDNSLENICMLDVLEHIEHDEDFLKLVWKKMSSEGKILITVPAYKFLWSKEDIEARHFRRYTIKQLKKRFEKSGFEVLYATYFFLFLPAPVFLFRTLPSLLGFAKSGVEKNRKEHSVNKASLTTKLLNKIMQFEMKQIHNNRKIPFGGSCLIVAKKKKHDTL